MKSNPANLQAARKEASERFFQIGLLILKEAGVKTWAFHEKGLCGNAWTERSHVLCPKPSTRRRLYILAHECAHISLNHTGTKPSHRQEYEAEVYAHQALRRHGVSVPKKETEVAKQYVARRIDQAIRIGKATKLDREAVRWCEAHHRPATKRAVAARAIKLLDLSGRQRTKTHVPTVAEVKRPDSELTLAQHLRAAATQSGISVNQIAQGAGLDQSGLNRFLNGTRDNLRLDVADRLFQFLNLTVVPRCQAADE